MQKIERLAEKFARVFYERRWTGILEAPVSEISIEDAYAVQDRVAQLRIQRGERIVGYKVGCTSAAIRKQFGLSEPIFGRLFHPHVQQEGVTVDWRQYANCAIEPELVFTIGADLRGVGLPDDQLTAAIESVRPGIELHHFHFWFDPPTSQELICSGGIHAGLIVGETSVRPHELSFADEVFSAYKDGELITAAPASEIMGGPLHSLRWLVDSLTRRGDYLPRGGLVIPGSPVELVTITQNCELRVEIDGVGAVIVHFNRAEGE